MDWKNITDKNQKRDIIKSANSIKASMSMVKAMIYIAEVMLTIGLLIGNLMRHETLQTLVAQFIICIITSILANIFVENELVGNTTVEYAKATRNDCEELNLKIQDTLQNNTYTVIRVKFSEVEFIDYRV